MNIVINGESRQTAAVSIEQLLSELGIDPRRVAVELNETILPKDEYQRSALADGDRIEIVQFVGGG